MSAARKSRGLSLDAAAHATKMRPDKIQALESDDYSRFNSTAYAKGFLLIYSRYLQVDVTDQLRDLEQTNRAVSIEDYQYLNNAPATPPVEASPRNSLGRRPTKPPSIMPLVVFFLLCVLAGAVLFVRESMRRISHDKGPAAPAVLEMRSPERDTAAEIKTAEAEAAIVAQADRSLLQSRPLPDRIEASVPPEPAPAATSVVTEETAPTEEPEHFLIVRPLRKTYVKIRTSAKAPIFYENFVYPFSNPLKVPGDSFFIEVEDGSAVQISMNGRLMAYSAPGIKVP